MLILGIDPGTAITGYGVVQTDGVSKKSVQKYFHIRHGCITTPKESLMPERLYSLQKQLRQIITEIKPSCVAVEQLFFGINSKTAITVGQARGVVMAAVAEAGIPFYEYQGLSVKKTLTGFGHADKKTIQKTVQKLLKLKEIPKPDDAADALAIAICHILRNSQG
ncbi:MAG: crossover junction endodeoxyribonuclease RuvC [Patescibacteria group bacterium]|nr:crossover junction endodeoxyribonuclease RuvC [Patescibacteria group bacterium]